MPDAKFIRKKEDFTCERCGFFVAGNVYTNHCPNCLWSRHVDINPGDRAAACGGLMKPVKIEKKGVEYLISHECLKCGHKKKNKMAAGDDFNKAAAISSGL